MRLAIDTNCRRVTRAGTSRYLKGLLGGLRTLANEDFEIREVEWPVDNLEYSQPGRAVKTLYRELIWGPILLPRIFSTLEPDIFHSPSTILGSPQKSIPHVCTLHDFALLRYPERYRSWQRKTGMLRMKSMLCADHVIAVSQFSADEAMELIGLPASRITTIHHGCDFREDAPEKTPASLTTPPEFFLFVGSLEPGKNLALLRDVWLAGQSSGKPLPPLVVVGARWHGVPHEGSWPDSWIEAGYVSDEELAFLYRRAMALLFPSKYEGFGFPPLEAMTLGTPVICAPVASLPEVVGESALLTPLETQSFLQAIKRLMDEPGLRDELIASGKTRSALFSWERCAQETLQVYKNLLRTANQ